MNGTGILNLAYSMRTMDDTDEFISEHPTKITDSTGEYIFSHPLSANQL